MTNKNRGFVNINKPYNEFLIHALADCGFEVEDIIPTQEGAKLIGRANQFYKADAEYNLIISAFNGVYEESWLRLKEDE